MKKLSRVEKKMRRRRFVFRLILLTTLTILLCAFALNSEFFNINSIKVTGNRKLSKDTIISGSTIRLGENIFKTDARMGKKELMKLPYIKEVNIDRKFPKEILINVIERKEIIQVRDISSYDLIDLDGHVLETIESHSENLPLFIGLKIENTNLGDNIFDGLESEEVRDFITEGHAIKLLPKMTEINMEDNNNVNISLNSGISVAFGTLDNVKYKMNYLDEILKDIEKNNIKCKMILMDRGDNPIVVLDEEG